MTRYRSFMLLSVAAAITLVITRFGAAQSKPGPHPPYPPLQADAPNVQTAIVEGLQLSATLDKGSYPAGSPVYLMVHLKNTTSKDIQLLIPWEDAAARLNVIVQTATGAQAPLTARAIYDKPDFDRPYKRPGVWSVLYGIAPGGRYDFILQPNLVYDMTQTGTYKVTVKMMVPKLAGQGTAVLETTPMALNVDSPDLQPVPYPDNPTGEEQE